MNMHKKMAHGALWSLLERGGQQGLSFVVFLVLARLLGPKEYGLANLCFIYFALTSMVVNGLVDGIVSLQVEDDLRLSSLFWAVTGVGVGIGVLCVITAQPLALFMNEPRLTRLLYWFSVIPVLVALAAVPNLLILKEMDFRVYAVRTLVATLIGGIAGIAMAFRHFGAYAIIGQQVAFYAVTNLVIWGSVSWRPRLLFGSAALREAARPGIAVTGVNVLAFLDGQAPRFMIGRILGPAPLGHFALATRLRFSLMEIFVTSPLTVIYPSLAKIGGDRERQQRMANTLISLGGVVVFPVAALAAALAPQYVPLVFGGKWIAAVPILQIYIAGMASGPFITVIQQLFRANNKMPPYFRLSAFFIAVNLAMTLLLFHADGLVLMSLGIVGMSFAAIPVYLWSLARHTGIDIRRSVLELWNPAAGAILGFLAVAACQLWAPRFANPWLDLFAAALAGICCCAAFCLLAQRRQIGEAAALIGKIRGGNGT